ncbi:hypothetical protein TWF481_004952 [Arthrobotrys musiformis]|uniref:Uncharacterized protein n=1 Tax=Arthrobotrys musiformis TaxID=47236 RepID=A0AAV9WL24_9PEZI
MVYQIRPHSNAVNFPLDKWPDWKALYPHEPDGWVEIEAYQLYCSGNCNCGEEGQILPRPNTSCGSQRVADRCSAVFACYCTAELIQPIANMADFPGATREDFQNALNRIPETIQNDNPHYYWEMHGLAVPRRPWDFMGWPRERAPRPIDQLPPWIANGFDGPFRPYEPELPLEGPDGPPADAEPRPNVFFDGNPGPGSGKPWKREVSEDIPNLRSTTSKDNAQGPNRHGENDETKHEASEA